MFVCKLVGGFLCLLVFVSLIYESNSVLTVSSNLQAGEGQQFNVGIIIIVIIITC